MSIIDEHAFGDFRSSATRRGRLTTDDIFNDPSSGGWRRSASASLRRQVLEYIRYTERRAYTQEFVPPGRGFPLRYGIRIPAPALFAGFTGKSADPDDPGPAQAAVLSRTFAIAGHWPPFLQNLERRLREDDRLTRLEEEFADDFEAIDELAEELAADDGEPPVNPYRG